MTKAFNFVCFLAIVSAVVQLYRGHERFDDFRSEFERLSKRYGLLDVKDDSKFLVTSVSDEQPNFFFWRVFHPDLKSGLCEKTTTLTGSSGSSNQGPEKSKTFVVSIRFRVIDGRPKLYALESSGASMMHFPNSMSGFLIKYWDQLEFKCLASEGPLEMETTDVMTFLTIWVPPNLLDELSDDNARYRKQLEEKPLFNFSMGTEEAFAKAPAND